MNKALRKVFAKMIGNIPGPGRFILDGYNNIVVRSGISPTITTRIDASSNIYLLAIDE